MNKKNTEQALEWSRHLVMIPVWALLATSAFIFVWTLTNYAFLIDLGSMSEKDLVIGLISIIDLFLLGVLTLMVATSLYVLYIDDDLSKKRKLPKALIVNSLDELKAKLGKVVFLILLVTFFKQALQFQYTTMNELVLLALSILLIALALYFTQDRERQ